MRRARTVSASVAVEDNGQGFDVSQALEPKVKGYSSLQDMRIYMESMGGRLEVRSTPGMGTTIDAWVPDQGRSYRIARAKGGQVAAIYAYGST